MGLVTFGGIPAAVPGGLIDEVRKRLQQIEQAGGLVLADLQPGDSIQIVEGPLAGYEAILTPIAGHGSRAGAAGLFKFSSPTRHA